MVAVGQNMTKFYKEGNKVIPESNTKLIHKLLMYFSYSES